MSFAATQMDLEITILSEVTQKNKYDITYMWNLIKISLFTQQKPTQKISKSNYGYERGNMRERINEEIGISIYTLFSSSHVWI